MKLGRPHAWIAIFSLALVLCAAVVSTRRTSPGELATVHGRVPELAAADGCAECHGGWRTSMTEACLDCHAGIGAQMEERSGLHGRLDAGAAARCAVCHSDHHGAGFGIVNLQSFVQAGFRGGRDAFEHDFVGFPMDGKHLELDCTECHANADVAVLDEGAHRFVGLDQDCASCHDDPHEGRMKLACAQCHGQSAWDELGSRDHDRFLPLVGGHEAIGCRDCHAQRTPWSLERIGGAARKASPRECADCHEDPHRDEFLGAVADVLATTTGLACGACHEPEHTSFREEGLVVTAELHACSGFSLAVPHDRTACADCHGAENGDDFAARYPGRAADDCAQCHADPHGGQFDHEPYSAKGCVACHDTRHFEPHAFGPRRHERTAFALTGAHLDTDCDACHELPPAGGDVVGPRVFAGTPAACEACHADAHRGFFEWLAQPLPASAADAARRPGGRRPGRGGKRAPTAGVPTAVLADPHVERGGPPSDCDACHGTGTFSELPDAGFDHARWTGFPVAGAHAQGECEVCHVPAAEPDEHGRRFGFVDAHFGAIPRADVGNGGSCAVCHEDPHRGAFDTPSRPVAVGGRVGCARCHVETSFREFGSFDHALWTNFELSGAHGAASCTDCHVPRARPDEFGRTWGEAAGRDCAACHEDPHARQFERSGRTDCQRCHDTTAFPDLRFDHDRNSRFPLDDAHERVACAACHLPFAAESGSLVVRYRPLPMECIDCHGSNEGPSPKRRDRGRKR